MNVITPEAVEENEIIEEENHRGDNFVHVEYQGDTIWAKVQEQ